MILCMKCMQIINSYHKCEKMGFVEHGDVPPHVWQYQQVVPSFTYIHVSKHGSIFCKLSNANS